MERRGMGLNKAFTVIVVVLLYQKPQKLSNQCDHCHMSGVMLSFDKFMLHQDLP